MAHFCSKCGTEIPVGEGFCPKCGSMVSMNAEGGEAQTGTPYQTGSGGNQINAGKTAQSKIGMIAGILGIAGILLSVFVIGGALGIAALILGVIGLSKRYENKTGMAVLGVITGGLAMLAATFMLCVILYDTGYSAGYDDGRDTGYNEGLDVPWYEKW